MFPGYEKQLSGLDPDDQQLVEEQAQLLFDQWLERGTRHELATFKRKYSKCERVVLHVHKCLFDSC